MYNYHVIIIMIITFHLRGCSPQTKIKVQIYCVIFFMIIMITMIIIIIIIIIIVII